jgi:hypothetical protein
MGTVNFPLFDLLTLRHNALVVISPLRGRMANKPDKKTKAAKDSKAEVSSEAAKKASQVKPAPDGVAIATGFAKDAKVDKVAKVAKVDKSAEASKASAAPAVSKGSKSPKSGGLSDTTDASGLDPRITNREFKLLLKPEGLDRRSQVNHLISLVRSFCEMSGVEFFHLDNAATSLRNVVFYDTSDGQLRDNKIILRVRESRRTIWVDDWCEVTLKCRSDDLQHALLLDPTPQTHHAFRLRLKQEILRGPTIGTTRTIYSNNVILDSVPIDNVFERTFGKVMEQFPGLGSFKIPATATVKVVGGRTNKVLEAVLPMGNLTFGDRVHAHLDLGIWMRSVGEPIIGELAFAYRVNSENRSDKKAHKRADKFFLALQSAIPSWLSDGSTKTALVYGKPE